MKSEDRVIGWPVIIFLLVFFWPVGIFLLHKKVKTDKEGARKNSKVLVCLGVIFMLFIFQFVWRLNQRGVEIKKVSPILLLMVFVNTYLFLRAILLRKEAARIEEQKILANKENKEFLEKMAKDLSFNYEGTIKETRSYSFNEVTYIDKQTKQRKTSKMNYEKAVEKSPKVVVCQSCGGKNTVIPGSVSECEYCGSPLS